MSVYKTTIFARSVVWISREATDVSVLEDSTWPQTRFIAEVKEGLINGTYHVFRYNHEVEAYLYLIEKDEINNQSKMEQKPSFGCLCFSVTSCKQTCFQ